jgi:hypothetical protein
MNFVDMLRHEIENIDSLHNDEDEKNGEVFDVEQKTRNIGIEKLVQRDIELKKMFKGEIKRKPFKIKKKVTREAFENYMKMYFEVECKVKVNKSGVFD